MISEALRAYAPTLERVFADRQNTVGASEIGQCARKTYWLKMEGDAVYGVARNPEFVESWGARLRGSVFESAIWVEALRARFGANLLYTGEEQRSLYYELLSATPDGLLVNQPRNVLEHLGVADIGASGELVVEAKTIDPRARLDTAKAEHAYQIQIQLGIFHAVTSHRPEYALISYTDASFWDETTEFVIARDPGIFAHAQMRAAQIMFAKIGGDLKPEGWIAGGNECRYCPFTTACGHERTAVPDTDVGTTDPQFLAEMTDLARTAKQYEVEADAAYAKTRETRHSIRERLRAKQLRRIATDDMRITWSPVRGRPAFDTEALRAAATEAGLDISQFEAVGAATDRLSIQVFD
jgi:hypothetical protein